MVNSPVFSNSPAVAIAKAYLKLPPKADEESFEPILKRRPNCGNFLDGRGLATRL
jgi:hypothetical protein